MGGDSFEGVQKLTNAEYIKITSQLLQKLRPLCQRIEPYIPLPQKGIHGDIDFLVILKKQYESKDLINELKIEKYINNNNFTINSVYKNKQVDFSFVKDDQQFQLASFYKSYSGIGAFLGLFLPSNQIKVTTKGMIALGFYKHLKVEVTVCDKVDQILKFYGLDSKRYHEGFKTLDELFEYLRNMRFLDEEKFAYHENKNSTKLIRGLQNYLKSYGVNTNKKPDHLENALQQTLNYFNKKEEYETKLHQQISQMQRIQGLNQKFNATHLLGVYQIKPKEINQTKKKFNEVMFNSNQTKYYEWVQTHHLQEILQTFGKICNLKQKDEKKQEEKVKEKS